MFFVKYYFQKSRYVATDQTIKLYFLESVNNRIIYTFILGFILIFTVIFVTGNIKSKGINILHTIQNAYNQYQINLSTDTDLINQSIDNE